jgi:hypothetical protein
MATMADRLPCVFIEHKTAEPVARLFINPVLHALVDKPERYTVCKHEGVVKLIPEPSVDPDELAFGTKVEVVKGVPVLDISRYVAEAWGLEPGHHYAWEFEQMVLILPSVQEPDTLREYIKSGVPSAAFHRDEQNPSGHHRPRAEHEPAHSHRR